MRSTVEKTSANITYLTWSALCLEPVFTAETWEWSQMIWNGSDKISYGFAFAMFFLPLNKSQLILSGWSLRESWHVLVCSYKLIPEITVITVTWCLCTKPMMHLWSLLYANWWMYPDLATGTIWIVKEGKRPSITHQFARTFCSPKKRRETRWNEGNQRLHQNARCTCKRSSVAWLPCFVEPTQLPSGHDQKPGWKAKWRPCNAG